MPRCRLSAGALLLGLLVPFLALGQSETGRGIPGEVLWRKTGSFFLGNAIATGNWRE